MRLKMTVVLALLVAVVWTLVPLHTGRTAVAQSEPSDSDCRSWERTYGGSGNDFGERVLWLPGEGYVLFGNTSSHGSGDFDMWLIKTDLDGNKLWDWTFGGSEWELGSAVQRTSDGGFILLGSTESQGNIDIQLIKTDEDGHQQWSKTFGAAGTQIGVSLQCTEDGGYIVLGHTASHQFDDLDIWLMKLNTDGTERWSQRFGGSDDDWACSVRQTRDGGYVLLGITKSQSLLGGGYWIIKTDMLGVMEWDRVLGRVDEYRGGEIIQAEDRGFVVIGQVEDPTAGDLDAWLAKTDADGKINWTRAFGGGETDEGYCVVQAEDEGFVFAGYTESKGVGGADAWLVKTDPQGNLLWEQTFGGARSETCDGLVESHGSYTLVGLARSFGSGDNDVWLVKYCCETADAQASAPDDELPSDERVAPDAGTEVTSPDQDQTEAETEPDEISPEPPAGEVAITDEALGRAVRRALSLGPEDPISESNLADLERLEIFEEGVQDLSGLEHAVNLRYLDLFANDVVDISALSSLTQLEWLDLSENSITDISSLAANPGLGEGDYVDLTFNLLDLTPGSAAMQDIQTLLDGGVRVLYEPQRE